MQRRLGSVLRRNELDSSLVEETSVAGFTENELPPARRAEYARCVTGAEAAALGGWGHCWLAQAAGPWTKRKQNKACPIFPGSTGRNLCPKTANASCPN
ncbi:hypothetical protein ON010_g4687 [Phytophthora cinnamomi]|nr:hypothetical protein ON010_g4687 [Phytophthora cinnamomi]